MEQKDNSKTHLIIIAILLFILGLFVGYYIGTNNKKIEEPKKEKKIIERKKETSEDIKKETSENPKKERESNHNRESTNNNKDNRFKGFEKISCDKIDCDVKDEVELNSKTITISIKYVDESKTIVKVENDVFLEQGPNSPQDYYYKIIKGSDNKDYLIIGYWWWGEYLAIYNDIGEKIYNFQASIIESDYSCMMNFEEEDNFFYIDNNIVYYYKYRKGTINNSEITVDLMKLSISSNKVFEEKTNQEKIISIGQCS